MAFLTRKAYCPNFPDGSEWKQNTIGERNPLVIQDHVGAFLSTKSG